MFFCLAVMSCKKQQTQSDQYVHHSCSTNDTVPNPQLIHDYLFNAGSFWIYKDSVSGAIDSCFVDSIVTGYQIYDDPPTTPSTGTCYHNDKYIGNKKTSLFPNEYYIVGSYMQRFPEYPNHGPWSPIFAFLMGNNLDVQFRWKDTLMQNCTIGTLIYNNVYKLFYINELGMNHPQEDSGYYYMKAGIGIIKGEYYNGGQKSVFELVRYHIN